MEKIEIGAHLPHLGRSVSAEVLADFAMRLEKAGVNAGWVSDHVCWPQEIASRYPYSDDGSFAPSPDMAWLDPIGTLHYVAGVTRSLRLGTTVLILPYRAPVVTAKQLATLDVLSGGRLILGVGIGWMEEEAKILGMPWDNRGRRTDEQLELFEALFTQASPRYDGKYYQLSPVGFEPKPLQRPLPIWVGGASQPAFKRAARFGTGFHAAFQPLSVVREEFEAVKRFAETQDRDPNELTLSLRIYLDPAGSMDPAKSIQGSIGQMQDRLGEISEAGVQHLVLDPVARGGVEARLNAIEQFMLEVPS